MSFSETIVQELSHQLMRFMSNSTLSGPNLDLLYIRQLNASPFCENYAKFYFDIKHLEKGLNRGW